MMAFEWDLKRELENISKHKVFFREAIEVFTDPKIIHVVTVRYTIRGHTVRIFGAAKWRKWRKFYERKNSKSK